MLMQLDRLAAVLSTAAYGEGDPTLDWEIRVHPRGFARLSASTVQSYSNAEDAFAAGLVLRDQILAAGYKLIYSASIEAAADLPDGDEPPAVWRGKVALGVVDATE